MLGTPLLRSSQQTPQADQGPPLLLCDTVRRRQTSYTNVTMCTPTCLSWQTHRQNKARQMHTHTHAYEDIYTYTQPIYMHNTYTWTKTDKHRCNDKNTHTSVQTNTHRQTEKHTYRLYTNTDKHIHTPWTQSVHKATALHHCRPAQHSSHPHTLGFHPALQGK